MRFEKSKSPPSPTKNKHQFMCLIGACVPLRIRIYTFIYTRREHIFFDLFEQRVDCYLFRNFDKTISWQ